MVKTIIVGRLPADAFKIYSFEVAYTLIERVGV